MMATCYDNPQTTITITIAIFTPIATTTTTNNRNYDEGRDNYHGHARAHTYKHVITHTQTANDIPRHSEHAEHQRTTAGIHRLQLLWRTRVLQVRRQVAPVHTDVSQQGLQRSLQLPHYLRLHALTIQH